MDNHTSGSAVGRTELPLSQRHPLSSCSSTVLLVTTHSHIFPGIIQVLALVHLSCCQPHLVHGLLWKASPIAVTQPALPPWSCTTLGKQMMHLPQRDQKEAEVPTVPFTALLSTPYQRHRNFTQSLDVPYVHHCVSAGLPASRAGRTPLNCSDSRQLLLVLLLLSPPLLMVIVSEGKKWNSDVYDVA